MLKDYQIAIIFATTTVLMATCAGGIVPGDPCIGTLAYMDWPQVGIFVSSLLGISLIIGTWVLVFAFVYLFSQARKTNYKEES